jgi:hypothetical protein
MVFAWPTVEIAVKGAKVTNIIFERKPLLKIKKPKGRKYQ